MLGRAWTHRTIAAPADTVWSLFTDPHSWPAWGPSVRAATLDDPRMRAGTRGTVTTVAGLTVPIEITAFSPGRSWSWHVAGLPATDHEVEPLGPDTCRAGIGVPWPAAPYLAVCRVGLRRLGELAERA